ncbi:MAG TPA: tetratricopeptide repeat protein [Blastocatellia bacterium]|nr:tetratricopeptide repeat protein [Blastocatellia bacterium]
MKRQALRLIGSAVRSIPVGILTIVLTASVWAQSAGGGQGSSPGPGRSGGATSHTIRGKIFLPSGGVPEQRIRVVLELNTGGIAGETFSDSVGNFEFRSLPSNTYKVLVPTDNRLYETGSESIELYGNFSRTFTVQIYLKDKGGEFTVKPKDRLLSVADLQEVPKSARKAYEKGLKLAQEKKPEEAVKQLELAVREFPEYLQALNKLGEQYLQLKKVAEAQATFEQALAVNPKYALPHINLGLIHTAQRRFADAITEFETGNRLDDSFPISHLNLGLALMSNTPPDFDRAEKEMTRALDLGGKSFAYARLYLFNLNLRRKTVDKAVEQLEAYLKEVPDAPDAQEVRERLANIRKTLESQQKGTAKQD